jgi:hypothetical protein
MSDTDKTPENANPAPLAYQGNQPSKSSSKGVIPGAIIGAVAGIPASYWMQNEMVRAKVNMVEYVVGVFTEIEAFAQNGLYGPVAMGVIGCAILGAVIGSKLAK